jgi:hypothetical protein
VARQRVGTTVLPLIALLTLLASRAFPFHDGVSGVGRTAVVLVGAARGLAGVTVQAQFVAHGDRSVEEFRAGETSDVRPPYCGPGLGHRR